MVYKNKYKDIQEARAISVYLLSGGSPKIATNLYSVQYPATLSEESIKQIYRKFFPLKEHGGCRKIPQNTFLGVYVFSEGNLELMQKILGVSSFRLEKLCGEYIGTDNYQKKKKSKSKIPDYRYQIKGNVSNGSKRRNPSY